MTGKYALRGLEPKDLRQSKSVCVATYLGRYVSIDWYNKQLVLTIWTILKLPIPNYLLSSNYWIIHRVHINIDY